MSRQHDAIGDFSEAGRGRLRDAIELLDRPSVDPSSADAPHRHLRAAIYLAGYAVECALKAYIAEVVGRRETFSEAIAALRDGGADLPDFQGRQGHNLRALRRATDLDPSFAADEALEEAWDLCHKWTPEWRYHPKPCTSRAGARRFVGSARLLYEEISQGRAAARGGA